MKYTIHLYDCDDVLLGECDRDTNIDGGVGARGGRNAYYYYYYCDDWGQRAAAAALGLGRVHAACVRSRYAATVFS